MDPEIKNDNIYPEATKYRNLCCKKCPCVRLLPTIRILYKYWDVNPCMPITVCLLITFSITMYFLAQFPRLSNTLKIISLSVSGFFLFLFLWAYFASMCMDPGYLPYDWIRTKRTKYSYEEIWAGTALRLEQHEFGVNHKPKNASYSHEVGRFVIRGDHICGWVTNWIAKRNRKQFNLMLLYGGLFCVSLWVWRFCCEKDRSTIPSATFFISLASFGLEVIFGISLLFTWAGDFIEFSKNQTQIDVFKKNTVEDYGICGNIKLVYGHGSCLCWLCPTPAFGDELDIEIGPIENDNTDTSNTTIQVLPDEQIEAPEVIADSADPEIPIDL